MASSSARPPSRSDASTSFEGSSSSPRRIVRTLSVEAEATPDGVRSIIYCKVSLPSTSASQLFDLLPTSRLLDNSVYPLPLKVTKSNGEAVRAARILGIDSEEAVNGEESSRRDIRLHKRRRSSVGSRPWMAQERARVMVEGTSVGIVVEKMSEEGFALDEEDEDIPSTATSSRPDSRGSSASPRVGAISPVGSTHGDCLELIVVLAIETSFGGIHLPKFANTIFLPIPSCLRNTLSFTIPSPSDSSSPWDLSVRPALSNAESMELEATREGSPSTRITGSFPSSSILLLRWRPQIPSSEPPPSFQLPRTNVETNWILDEEGGGTANVVVRGEFEYAGLKDKHSIEIELGLDEASTVGVKVEEISGGMVTESDLKKPATVGESPKSKPGVARLPSCLDDFSSPLDDSLASLESSTSSASTTHPHTPTPRHRRRSSARPHEPRPPSFTSLFDTAPPAPPEVTLGFDTSLIDNSAYEFDLKNGRNSSLLSQAAPFESEAAVMDMSFEDTAVVTAEEARPAKTPVIDSSIPPSRKSISIPVQISLSKILQSSASLPPSFEVGLKLRFSPNALKFAPTSSLFQVELPTFSVPASLTQESLVTVSTLNSSGDVAKVDLVASSTVPLGPAQPETASPLPAIDGKARWSTSRNLGPSNEPVRVQVKLTSVSPKMSNDDAPSKELADEETDFSIVSSLEEPPSVHGDVSQETTIDAVEIDRGPSRTQVSQGTLPLVSIQVTPISPTISLSSPSTSEWRIFYRLTLPSSSITDFVLPIPTDSKIKLHEAWGIDGRSVLCSSCETNTIEGIDGELKGLQVVGEEAMREVLYEETKAGEDIVGAALLPFLSSKAARYEVEVLEAEGYDLNVVVHDFDRSTRSKGSTNQFTKFLVPAHARPFLPLRFKPSSTAKSIVKSSPHTCPLPNRRGAIGFWTIVASPWIVYLLWVLWLTSSHSTSSPSEPSLAYSVASRPSPRPLTNNLPPLVSYSTVTHTSTVVSTTTQVSLSTVTLSMSPVYETFHHTYTKTLTHLVAPTPTSSRTPVQPLATPSPPRATSQYGLADDEGGANVVVVWLHRLELKARAAFDELIRLLRIVA